MEVWAPCVEGCRRRLRLGSGTAEPGRGFDWGPHSFYSATPRWSVVADPLTWCLCRFLGCFLGSKYVSVTELSVKAPLTTVPGDSPLGARSVTLAKGTDLDAAGLPLKSWLSGSELFSLWSVSWILCASVSYLQHGTFV